MRSNTLAARVVLAVVSFICFAPVICFADTPGAPRKVITIEGITEYQLDNGLRVLLFPDPSASTVTVNLTVFVGSRHEGYGETGMAHLLEHMVFKGTPRHPNIPKDLRDHGARFNGTTWVDRTNYFETMAATDANLEFGLFLEADRLVNSFIRREDLVSEMTVVRNEFELGENMPDRVLSQRMLAVAYEWHNYGKSTIGNRSDIERVPIQNLQAFYRKYYRPDNAMLVVAGKFAPEKALSLISKYFAPLKRPESSIDTTYTEEPAQDGERTVVLRRVGSIGVVGVVYHIASGVHEDFPAVEVLEELLTREPSGRLYQALVVTRKASTVSGNAFGWHDPGVLELSAQVDPGKSLEDVRDTMLGVLEKLAEKKITVEEVDRAKRRLLKDGELRMADSGRVGIELSDWGAQGDWRLLFLHRDRLAKVTVADINRVAARYLQPSNRTVGLYIPTTQPQRAEIPNAPAVATLVKNYKGGKDLVAGEAFDPTPANIEGRVQRLELPGGVKVALLPKKSRGEIVNAELVLRYGNEESLKGLTTAGEVLPALMLRGTKKHTRQQLQDELDKLKARVSAGRGGGPLAMMGGSAGAITFSIECKRAALPDVLRLIGEVLHEPTFPPEELEVIKRQRRESLEKAKKEPFMLVLQSMMRKLSPYPPDDVRYQPTIEESIARLEALKVEQVRRLYQEQVGAAAGEFVAVGDFDQTATRELLGELLKDWKPSTPYRRIPQEAFMKVPGDRENIITPDKANALFAAGHALALTDADPDYAALHMADFILGGSFSSRLITRIRHKDGLSYGGGSNVAADAKDKAGVFLMFAICNPINIDKVDKAIAEELDRFRKEGVSTTELAEAKKGLLEQMKVERSSDRTLAMRLAQNLEAGRTFAYYADLEKKLAELTPEEVNSAIRNYLQPQRLIIVRGGDFTKKTSAR
jgi:zinc protease